MVCITKLNVSERFFNTFYDFINNSKDQIKNMLQLKLKKVEE